MCGLCGPFSEARPACGGGDFAARRGGASQAVKLRRVMRRYRMAACTKGKRAKLRKGQLFTQDFTVKLFAGVEFWMERLPALPGSAPRLRQAGARRLFPLLI